jgi:hypothetical protein
MHFILLWSMQTCAANVIVGDEKGVCRELWLTYAVKALESYSYFSMSLIYVIYLTDNFGVGDVSAGASYGIWGMLIVLWGVVLGPAIDYLGAQTSHHEHFGGLSTV